MIKAFSSYDGLFACEELSDSMREYVMSVADRFEYDGYDSFGDYVTTYKYYTKKGELIADIRRMNGEYSLEEFNKYFVADWEKAEIQKNLKELDRRRIESIEKVFGYLEKCDLNDRLIEVLKRDCFTTWMNEEKCCLSFEGEVLVFSIKDKRFDEVCSCRFYTAKERFENETNNSLNPWVKKGNDKIQNSASCLIAGVAGELEEYVTTEWLEKNGNQKYKYFKFEIGKWYMKDVGLSYEQIGRKEGFGGGFKLGWFGL